MSTRGITPGLTAVSDDAEFRKYFSRFYWSIEARRIPSSFRLFLPYHRLGCSSDTLRLLFRKGLERLLLQVGVNALFVDQPHPTLLLPWLFVGKALDSPQLINS
jgi:hypothetical protein